MDDRRPISNEEQWLHLQRLAAAGQLSAAYAHEINNLLTGVLGYASLVRRMVADRPAVAKDVDRIREQAERIGQMAQHLLDLSRRTSPDMEKVDLGFLLDRTLALRERQLKRQNIEIVRSYNTSLPQVEGYPEELEQVFLNLINNAIQAMSTGGRLEVATSFRHTAEEVCVEIKDTGPGIPAHILPHIFEPFFTTKPRGEGTGLGLYVCQRIVERHSGTMTVESQKGRGTRARVVLPLSQASRREGEQEREGLSFFRQGGRRGTTSG